MNSSNIIQRIAQDLQGGNIAQAESLCLQLISDAIPSFEAHYFLGVIREHQQRFDEAMVLLQRASEINPRSSEVLLACGKLLDRLGNYHGALEYYEKTLNIDAACVKALNSRALVLHKLGLTEKAIASCTEALRIEPQNFAALCNRGTMYLGSGAFEAALKSFDTALNYFANYPQAMNGRGNALRGLGRLTEALDAYDKLIQNFPKSAEAHCNKGIVLTHLRQLDVALQCLDKAVLLRPDFAQAWNAKANLFYNIGKLEEALSSFDRAIQINPKYAEALNNKGRVLRSLGRLEDAIISYNSAIELSPRLLEASINKGLCLLVMGNFEAGWQLYERRQKVLPRVFSKLDRVTAWDGLAEIRGKSVLLCAEQGLGDTIQFCRYAKVIEERGGRPILAVPRALVRLLNGLTTRTEIVDSEGPLPNFDYYIPLMSMPFACKTSLESVPADRSYLVPEDELVQIWRRKVGTKGIKVGICWQGNRMAPDDIYRSIPLDYFEPLSLVEGCRLISLQKGDAVYQMYSTRVTVETLGDCFDAGPHSFIDSAAVVVNLDLVITSDTAIAHLAASIGCLTWLAIPYAPDWRWLMRRNDSPWYPTMRIFRQPTPGDWAHVFRDIADALREFARHECPGRPASAL